MRKLTLILLLLPFIFSSCDKKEKKEKLEKYTIEQFMDNTSIMGSSFSPDKKKIMYTSNEDGYYNAYAVHVDGSETEQLTERKETTYGIGYFPEDERILFMSDSGGNEIYHIYMREQDGTIKDITPFEGSRASFAGWSRDEKSFFFSSNKRDKKYMDYYEMPLENMEPEMIFENNKGYNLGAISNNKKLMAFSKVLTRTNTNMYLYDRESNEMKLLSEHEGEATYSPVDFSDDNKYLYFLTDEGSEFNYLKKMELSSGK